MFFFRMIELEMLYREVMEVDAVVDGDRHHGRMVFGEDGSHSDEETLCTPQDQPFAASSQRRVAGSYGQRSAKLTLLL